MARMVSRGAMAKMVPCRGTTVPSFQPNLSARARPTTQPVRSRTKSRSWASGQRTISSLNIGARYSGSTAKLAKKLRWSW